MTQKQVYADKAVTRNRRRSNWKYDRIYDTLILTACGGKRVEGSKKMRATRYLTDYENESYQWPVNFWGPFDFGFNSDIETAVRSGLIHRGIDLRRREPIHHPHMLFNLGISYFVDFVKGLTGSEREELRGKVSEIIAWLRLPSRYSVNRAMYLWNSARSSEVVGENFLEVTHPEEYFTKSILTEMRKFYEKSGFVVKSKREDGMKSSFTIGVPPKAARRYNYLRIEEDNMDRDFRNAAEDIENQFDTSLPLYLMKELRMTNPVEVKEAVKQIKDSCFKSQDIKKMNDMFDYTVSQLGELFDRTYSDGIGVKLEIGRRKSMLNASKIRQVMTSKWRPEFYLQFWHILQPYELRDGIGAYGRDTVTRTLAYG